MWLATQLCKKRLISAVQLFEALDEHLSDEFQPRNHRIHQQFREFLRRNPAGDELHLVRYANDAQRGVGIVAGLQMLAGPVDVHLQGHLQIIVRRRMPDGDAVFADEIELEIDAGIRAKFAHHDILGNFLATVEKVRQRIRAEVGPSRLFFRPALIAKDDLPRAIFSFLNIDGFHVDRIAL